MSIRAIPQIMYILYVCGARVNLRAEQRVKPVAMELTPDNLTYLRSASMACNVLQCIM